MAIDRATRWVFMHIYGDMTEASSVDFVRRLKVASPIKISKILTDNGSQSTDRFTTKDKKPSGKHAFDVACAVLPAEHRLTPPRHPQTNGMVERFNGRINELLQQSRFDSKADLQARSGQSYSLNAFMIKRDLTARRYDMKNGFLRSTSAHLFAPACRSGRAWRRR